MQLGTGLTLHSEIIDVHTLYKYLPWLPDIIHFSRFVCITAKNYFWHLECTYAEQCKMASLANKPLQNLPG